MNNYSISFTNNSGQSGCVCVFQQFSRGQWDGPVSPIAWLANQSYPGAVCGFSWTDELSFVWGLGNVTPGATFNAEQIISGNVTNQNMVTFDKQNGKYLLAGPSEQAPPGALIIKQENVVPNEALVGMGMHGLPSIICQAQPYIMLYIAPTVSYWMAFGNFPTGTILDTNSLTNIVEVNFPASGSVNVSLNADDTWTVSAN